MLARVTGAPRLSIERYVSAARSTGHLARIPSLASLLATLSYQQADKLGGIIGVFKILQLRAGGERLDDG